MRLPTRYAGWMAWDLAAGPGIPMAVLTVLAAVALLRHGSLMSLNASQKCSSSTQELAHPLVMSATGSRSQAFRTP